MRSNTGAIGGIKLISGQDAVNVDVALSSSMLGNLESHCTVKEFYKCGMTFVCNMSEYKSLGFSLKCTKHKTKKQKHKFSLYIFIYIYIYIYMYIYIYKYI